MTTDAHPAASLDHMDRLAALRDSVDGALRELLDEEEGRIGGRLTEPVRYAVLSPGKRIRPSLMIAGYRAVGGTDPEIVHLACAVELIHAYSLVHDDLPCMDDDVLRRGAPTMHVRYGVGPAVLAAAALMPTAVGAICRGGRRLSLPPEVVRRLVAVLTAAAGGSGMVGGQLLDLRAEGHRIPRASLERIHRGKTAALIAAAAEMGGVAAGASGPEVERLRRFGTHLGLAFQVVDDILDETGDTDELGKESGRDTELGKATFPSLFGLSDALKTRQELADRARSELAGLADPGVLTDILELAVERRN